MQKKVDKYGVTLWSGNHSIAGYVGLYDDDYRIIAQITLFNEGTTIPDNSMSGDLINLSFPFSKYVNLIDLLRNESPIYVQYNESNKFGRISTTKEEVGEGE